MPITVMIIVAIITMVKNGVEGILVKASEAKAA